jgi:hypothetical protein
MYGWSAQKERTRVWIVRRLNGIKATLWAIPENFQKQGDRKCQWNVHEQTAALRCDSSPTFQGMTAGFCWWLGRTTTDIRWVSTQPPTTPWRWGRSQSMKCQRNVTSWHRCLFQKVLFISVAEKASRKKKMIANLCSFSKSLFTNWCTRNLL